jgi:hypothetical protein
MSLLGIKPAGTRDPGNSHGRDRGALCCPGTASAHPGQWESVLRLLDSEGVDATNNLGEREGRPALIAGKLSGGAGPRQEPRRTRC